MHSPICPQMRCVVPVAFPIPTNIAVPPHSTGSTVGAGMSLLLSPSPPHPLALWDGDGAGVAVGMLRSVSPHTVALEMLTAIFHSIFGKNVPSSH